MPEEGWLHREAIEREVHLKAVRLFSRAVDQWAWRVQAGELGDGLIREALLHDLVHAFDTLLSFGMREFERGFSAVRGRPKPRGEPSGGSGGS